MPHVEIFVGRLLPQRGEASAAVYTLVENLGIPSFLFFGVHELVVLTCPSASHHKPLCRSNSHSNGLYDILKK